MIHMNSNRMYFLSGGTNSESWSQVNGQWPLTLHTDSNRAQLGGSLDTAGSISSSGNMSISGYITAGSTITGILLRLRAAWHAARPERPFRERTQWVRPQWPCSFPSIGRYGGASSDLSLILNLVTREMARKHGILQHWLFGSQSPVQAEACTKMGSRNCSGMGDSSSGSPAKFRGSPLLCGRKLFFWPALSEHGRAGLFGPLSPLPWPLGHVRLISFLVWVWAALFFLYLLAF